MNVAWGVMIVLTSTICWGGQVVSWLAPDLAVRLGLADSADDVDRTFWLDGRGEAAWDSLVLWTMPLAGVLLMVDHDWWSYLALIGGGSYVYFAGRGIFVRVRMRRDGIEIGSDSAIRTALTALTIWGVIALITVVAAISSLEAA